MSEHKEPIPSMIYNAAVGGHVTNSQQIIDENLNKEQSQINQETDIFIKSKGNANGIASLDESGKVPSSQLPSYVDDVIEGYYYGTEDPDTHEVTYDFYTDAEHTQKITPERGKIYLDISTSKQYRWTGSVYSEISSSITLDEEDLTNANGVIKFKNKAFSLDDFSGLGRIYLRKNIFNNQNILTQDMFYKDGENNTRIPNTNTIFVIQYDYTLTSNITIPENCVLWFQGGSLSGAYTLTGQNTCIISSLKKIFDVNITIAGTWNVGEAYPEWWGAISNSQIVANIALNQYFAFCVLNKLKADGKSKTYLVDDSTSALEHYGLYVPGGIIIQNFNFKLKEGCQDLTTLLNCKYDDNDYIIENCSFEGVLRTPTEGREDGGNHGIFMTTSITFPNNWQDVGNIIIKNCNFNNIQSYGIFPTPIKGKLIVEDCDFKCHACGILSYAVNCEIRNCTYTYLESQGTTVHCLAIDEIEQFNSPTAYKKNISIINSKAPEIYHLSHNPQSGVIYGNINIIGCECRLINISYLDATYIPIDRIFIKDSIFTGESNIDNIQNTNLILENTEFKSIFYTTKSTSVNITATNCIFNNRYWVHGSSFGVVKFDNCYIKHNNDNEDGFFNTRWGSSASASKIIFNNCIAEDTLVFEGFSGPIFINGLTMLNAVNILRGINEECYISGLICAYAYGSNYAFTDCGGRKIVVSGLVKDLPVVNSSGVVDLTQKI